MSVVIDGTTGITVPEGASQAQAEAGTDNTVLMTPLRTAQSLAAKTYVKSANWADAKTGDTILADTTSAAWTLTLPSSPAAGTILYIIGLSSFAANNLTLDRNGSTIEGAASNVALVSESFYGCVVYNGTTWLVKALTIDEGIAPLAFIPNWSTPTTTMSSSGTLSISSTVADERGIWAYLVGGGGCGNNAAVYQSGWGFGGSGGRALLYYSTVGNLRGSSVTIGGGVTNSGSWQGTLGTPTTLTRPDTTVLTTALPDGSANSIYVDPTVTFGAASTGQTSTYFNMAANGVITVSPSYSLQTLTQPTQGGAGTDGGGPNWVFCASEGYGAYSGGAGGTTGGTSVYAGGGNASNGAYGTFPGGGGGGVLSVNTNLAWGAGGVAKFYIQP